MAISFENAKTVSSDIWDRVGYIEITIGDQKPMVFKGLDFKFRVTKVLASMVEGTMHVDIHGLPQTTMNQIITVCNKQEAIIQRKKIRVYAGYRDPNDESYEGDMIACMDILYAAVTTPPPESWITIEGVQSAYYRYMRFKFLDSAPIVKKKKTIKTNAAYSVPSVGAPGMGAYYAARQRNQEYEYEEEEPEYPIPVETVAQHFVEALNRAFRRKGMKNKIILKSFLSDETKNKAVPYFSFEGSLSEFATKFSKAFDVFTFFDFSYGETDTLYILDIPKKSTQMDAMNRLKPTVYQKKLDVEHGLVGIPTISNTTSLKCRCLLDSKLSVGDFIMIDSKVMPVVRSEEPGWQIQRISFSGHMRGTEWYTDITAVDYRRFIENENQKEPKIDMHTLI